jgi:tetratricopeptide (TPR) repeat protein
VLDEPELKFPDPLTIDSSGYDQVLDRIRKTLRLADYPTAEALLMKAADRKDKQSAEYFNLLGVLYEAQHKWRLARKCYDKAIAVDKHFAAAQANMRRLHELYTLGHSSQAIMLGDEADDMWFAKLPEPKN